jgi:hypothetical protein
MDERTPTHINHGRGSSIRQALKHGQPSPTDEPDRRHHMGRFTSNVHYSTHSACTVQFQGSFVHNDWASLWVVKAENKCKFFCWLILQKKLWMTDRIIKHGGQANPICHLCHIHPENVGAVCSEHKNREHAK